MIHLPYARLAHALVLAAAVAPMAAAAQTAPATDAALGGPPVPGVCVLSREAILSNAKVGRSATARLQQLAAEAQAEVDRERTPLESEIKALEAQKASLAPAQFAARSKPLQARWNAMQAKADLRSRELEATRQKALAQIAVSAQPVVADVYHERNCGLLFTREAMLGGNPAADLTAAVIAALDAKTATMTFNRESLAQAQAPQSPAGTH